MTISAAAWTADGDRLFLDKENLPAQSSNIAIAHGLPTMEQITAFIAALGGAGPLSCLVIVVGGFIWLIHSLGHKALAVIERTAKASKESK